MSSKKSGKPQHGEILGLGARIRAARGDRSQQWLADSLRVDKARISEYERGLHQPSATALDKIAEATGCNPAWLLTGQEAAPTDLPSSGRVQDLAPGYERIPEDVRGDGRLLKAIDELVDILRAPDRKAAEWLLGNIEIFAERARAQLEPRRRRKAG